MSLSLSSHCLPVSIVLSIVSMISVDGSPTCRIRSLGCTSKANTGKSMAASREWYAENIYGGQKQNLYVTDNLMTKTNYRMIFKIEIDSCPKGEDFVA